MSKPSAGSPDRSIMKIALASLAGSSIEWYDFFLYGTAAGLVFPTLFFPKDLPPLVAQIAAYATFAVGFIARPVGGVVFGHYGDKLGRKPMLVIAMMMMGAGTTLIGLMPSYAQIGVAAPIALVVLRFIQGFAVGGQWGGAVLLITETAPVARRGYFGGYAQAGVPVGVLLANLIFLAVTATVAPAAFQAWGWRIPFLSSIALIGIALYVQLKLEDTPAFRELEELKNARDDAIIARAAAVRGVTVEAVKAELALVKKRSPVLEVIRTYPKEILLAAGAFIAVNGNFYIFIAFVLAYGTKFLHLPQQSMLLAVMIAALVMIPAIIFFSALSDRFGRRGLYLIGAAIMAAWSLAVFPMMDTKSLPLITLAIGGGLVITAIMYGPQAAFYSEIFTTKVRYSGASLGYQIGAIFGGGMAPIVATALLQHYNSGTSIGVYMAILSVITFVSVFLLRETRGANMDEALITVEGPEAQAPVA